MLNVRGKCIHYSFNEKENISNCFFLDSINLVSEFYEILLIK